MNADLNRQKAPISSGAYGSQNALQHEHEPCQRQG